VGRLATFGGYSGLLSVVAAVAVDAAPPRPGFFAPEAAPRSPEIMLYVSHSVGAGAGGGPMRPTFGLRVQEVRQAANSGDPEAGDPMQHRELVNWQMEAHSNLHISDLRVKLGNRVTYDLTGHRFGSPSARSALQISGLPTLRNAPLSPPQPAVLARSSTAKPASHESNGDNANAREIAVAAMAAIAPAHFSPSQRQMAQRQGGIAGVLAAPRLQGARE
jgi:hypothetical protein